MAYSKASYDAVEPVAPGLTMLRDALDCENLGVSVIEAGPDWEGMEHDHADEGQEEVYLLVEGRGVIEVDGETVALEPGDAVRVAPAASRSLRLDEESTVVAVGAP